MVAAFIGLQAGTLFVYQGQELGMFNLPRTWTIEEYKDLETQNLYRMAMTRFGQDEAAMALFLEGVRSKARDHARSPVQWNVENHGGFSTADPWMRANDDHMQCNAEQQMPDSGSVFTFWRRVLQLRKRFCDIFIYGRFELVKHVDEFVFCYRRTSGTAVATVMLNFSDQQQIVPHEVRSVWTTGKEILVDYSTRKGPEMRRDMSLKPFEAVVVIECQSEHYS